MLFYVGAGFILDWAAGFVMNKIVNTGQNCRPPLASYRWNPQFFSASLIF